MAIYTVIAQGALVANTTKSLILLNPVPKVLLTHLDVSIDGSASAKGVRIDSVPGHHASGRRRARRRRRRRRTRRTARPRRPRSSTSPRSRPRRRAAVVVPAAVRRVLILTRCWTTRSVLRRAGRASASGTSTRRWLGRQHHRQPVVGRVARAGRPSTRYGGGGFGSAERRRRGEHERDPARYRHPVDGFTRRGRATCGRPSSSRPHRGRERGGGLRCGSLHPRAPGGRRR